MNFCKEDWQVVTSSMNRMLQQILNGGRLSFIYALSIVFYLGTVDTIAPPYTDVDDECAVPPYILSLLRIFKFLAH
jgi:hypothetical protein